MPPDGYQSRQGFTRFTRGNQGASLVLSLFYEWLQSDIAGGILRLLIQNTLSGTDRQLNIPRYRKRRDCRTLALESRTSALNPLKLCFAD